MLHLVLFFSAFLPTITAQINCPAGRYYNNTRFLCLDCSPGIWCPFGSTSDSVGCSAGYACPGGGLAPRLCVEGSFSPRNSSTCSTCYQGAYCPTKGLPLPIPCPRGRYRSFPGATSLSDCLFADLGYYSTDRTRQLACRAGSYQDFIGQSNSNCIDCGSGTFSNVTGRTTPCELCPAGSYCQHPRSVLPIPCDPGSFSPITGATSYDDCYSCPEGTFAITQGTTGLDVMAKPSLLLNSTTCALCIAGYYCGKRTDEPMPCDAGKFSHETGASTIDTCRNCEPGFWCHEPGTSDETRPCPKGWSCPGNGTVSYKCEAGTYSSVNPQDKCSMCPKNTWSDTIGASSIATCVSCPTGTSSDKLGASSNSSCYACPSGKYATGDNRFCQNCPDGYYCPGNAPRQICPLHTFNPVRRATKGLLCLVCPAGSGTNKTGTGASTECSPKFAPILVSANISISGISYTSILVAGAQNFTRDVQAIFSATINVDPSLVSIRSVTDTSSTGQRLLRFVDGSGILARSLTGSGSILVSIRVSATISTSSSVVSAINGISSSASVVKMIAAVAAVPESTISVAVKSVISESSPVPSGVFNPPPPATKSEGISIGTIIGASIGGGLALLLILTFVYVRFYRSKISTATPSSDSLKTVPTLASESIQSRDDENPNAFAVRNPMNFVTQIEDAVELSNASIVNTQAPPVLLPPPMLMPPSLLTKTETVSNEHAPFAVVPPFVSELPASVTATPTLPPPSTSEPPQQRSE